MMDLATCFLYLESSHVSSNAELDWSNSRGRQDEESARALQQQLFAEGMMVW